MDSKHHQSQHQYGLSSWLDIDSALLLIISCLFFCPVGNRFNLESHNQRFCFVVFLSQEHDVKNCPRRDMVRSTVQTYCIPIGGEAGGSKIVACRRYLWVVKEQERSTQQLFHLHIALPSVDSHDLCILRSTHVCFLITSPLWQASHNVPGLLLITRIAFVRFFPPCFPYCAPLMCPCIYSYVSYNP